MHRETYKLLPVALSICSSKAVLAEEDHQPPIILAADTEDDPVVFSGASSVLVSLVVSFFQYCCKGEPCRLVNDTGFRNVDGRWCLLGKVQVRRTYLRESGVVFVIDCAVQQGSTIP